MTTVDWAVALEGRTDPGSVLLLFAERSEAEAVASEMRRRVRPAICVRPFLRPDRDGLIGRHPGRQDG